MTEQIFISFMEKCLMKKFITTLVSTSFLVLSLTGCPATNAAGGDKPASGTPATGTPAANPFPKSADFIKLVQCLGARAGTDSTTKTKYDGWVNEASKVSDADWAAKSATYADNVKGIDTAGCK